MLDGNLYKVRLNMKMWYDGLTDPDTATIKDAVQYMVSVIQDVGINCNYIETTTLSGVTYPGIRLPWVDGTLGTDESPVIMVEASIDTLVTTSVQVKFGIANDTSCQLDTIYVTSGATHTTIQKNALTNKVYLLIIDTTKMSSKNEYGFGLMVMSTTEEGSSSGDVSSVADYYMCTYAFVTTVTNIEDGTIHNVLITNGNTGSTVKFFLNVDGALTIYSGGAIFDDYTSCSDVVRLIPLMIDKYKSGFYITNQVVYTLIKQYTKPSFLANNMRFYPSAITIDDISYDVEIVNSTWKNVLILES